MYCSQFDYFTTNSFYQQIISSSVPNFCLSFWTNQRLLKKSSKNPKPGYITLIPQGQGLSNSLVGSPLVWYRLGKRGGNSLQFHQIWYSTSWSTTTTTTGGAWDGGTDVGQSFFERFEEVESLRGGVVVWSFFVFIYSRKKRSFGVDFCFIYKILEGKYELYFCCLGIFRHPARNDKKEIVGKSWVVVFFLCTLTLSQLSSAHRERMVP